MGVPQLADLVLETANAPGTSAFILGGAPDGRQTFADAFPAGGEVYYYASDGTQSEWGVGTLTVGNPNTLARTKVLGNLFGTANALNFTSAISIWCEVPAQKTPYLDDGDLLPVSSNPDFEKDIALSAKVAEQRYFKNSGGNIKGPIDFGDKTVSNTVTHKFFTSGIPPTGTQTPDVSITVEGGTPGTANKGTFTLEADALNVPDTDDFTSKNALNAKVAEDHFAPRDTVNSNIRAECPVGTIMLYAGNTPPDGFLFMQGATFSATAYPLLSAVDGFKNGVLADLRGLAPRGLDLAAGVDALGASRKLLDFQDGSVIVLSAGASEVRTMVSNNQYAGNVGLNDSQAVSGSVYTTVVSATSGGNSDFGPGKGGTVRVKNFAINYMVRAL